MDTFTIHTISEQTEIDNCTMRQTKCILLQSCVAIQISMETPSYRCLHWYLYSNAWLCQTPIPFYYIIIYFLVSSFPNLCGQASHEYQLIQ